MQWFLTTDGEDIAKVTSGTTAPSNMQAELKVLYKLLLDLIYGGGSTYGQDYEDPLCDADGEHPGGGDYSGTLGRSDSSFEQETEDMKSAIDALLDRHSTIKGSIANDTNLSYNSTFANVITEIGTYKDVIKRRIGEITNRIGVVNGKDAGVGGTGGPTAGALANSFVGFTFPTGSNGKGYANTVYSHANFLAGKKINLLGKVLKAILAVQAMYDSVTTKRAEYYEYNQAD